MAKASSKIQLIGEIHTDLMILQDKVTRLGQMESLMPPDLNAEPGGRRPDPAPPTPVK